MVCPSTGLQAGLVLHPLEAGTLPGHITLVVVGLELSKTVGTGLFGYISSLAIVFLFLVNPGSKCRHGLCPLPQIGFCNLCPPKHGASGVRAGMQ